jgi:hypothetical protein
MLSRTAFTQLTRDDRTAWARLSPEARRLILSSHSSPPGDATPPAFKVHAAIQSDYPDPGHGTSPDPSDHDAAPAPGPGTAASTRNDQTILTMLTDRRHVPYAVSTLVECNTLLGNNCELL